MSNTDYSGDEIREIMEASENYPDLGSLNELEEPWPGATTNGMIDCPVCGEEVEFNQVPQHIRDSH